MRGPNRSCGQDDLLRGRHEDGIRRIVKGGDFHRPDSRILRFVIETSGSLEDASDKGVCNDVEVLAGPDVWGQVGCCGAASGSIMTYRRLKESWHNVQF